MRQVSDIGLAEFSECMTYRYLLMRMLKGHGGVCVFIMLNPSEADAFLPDPTVGRCVDFGNSWNCSELFIVNLSPLKSKNPQDLKDAEYAPHVMYENWKWILKVLRAAAINEGSKVIAGWGNNALDHEICRYFKDKIKKSGAQISSLNVNITGEPQHPLYILSTTQPVPYEIR